MDRLIIEAALSDVSEIFLETGDESNGDKFEIVFGFKATHTDQVLHAFAGLKEIAKNHEVQLIICKTRISGLYDLEIKAESLDEPIRIMNKTIDHETLGAIEDRINRDQHMVLTTNVSEEINSIVVRSAHIKTCETDH
ncbi:hypothetical protein ACXZ1K_16840 [Pedobacter sp. PWIIR3]